MTATALDTLSLRSPVEAALREARTELAQIYGNRLVKVILYGSHARGEAHPESDVDVLFVLQGDFSFTDELKRTNPLVSQILLKHHELLALLPMAASRLHDPLHPLMINVRKEGVEL
jgi:predicted nucleotidyltransferase